MPALIDVSALRKSFGQTLAVGGVSFTAGRGEVVGFLGPNGAGKTTTMRMIAGYLSPDSGSTTINGVDVAKDPVAAKANIGYLPEGAPLYGDMTTRAFLEFIAAARHLPRTSRSTAIDRVVDRLALGPVMSRRIDALSKGFRRRVGIAQAILHDPPVLILDEPTDGLDPNQKHEMRALIDEMAATKAIVISTHVLEEVDAVCSRAIIIDAGQIRFDGTPAALRQRSTYHNAVVVTLSGEAATLAEIALRKSSHVESLTRIVLGGDRTELLLRAKDNKPIVAEIERILASSAIVPDTIAVERGRLDEVFRGLTTDAQMDGIDTGEAA